VRAFGPTRLAETIKFHQTIGCHLMIVGGDRRFTDPEGSKRYAEEMNVAAEALKKGGSIAAITTTRKSSPRWATPPIGICSPSAPARTCFSSLLKRYPGRFKTLHMRGKVPKGAIITSQESPVPLAATAAPAKDVENAVRP